MVTVTFQTHVIKGVPFDTWHDYYACTHCDWPAGRVWRANNPFGGVQHFAGDGFLIITVDSKWRQRARGLVLTRRVGVADCAISGRRHEIWDWQPQRAAAW